MKTLELGLTHEDLRLLIALVQAQQRNTKRICDALVKIHGGKSRGAKIMREEYVWGYLLQVLEEGAIEASGHP